MKKISALIILIQFCLSTQGQTIRYFQFHSDCNMAWQDSSFIAATADTVVIDSVLADLARPESVRQMITGRITDGNAGYNHNAGHWFLWHYIEDHWKLTEASVEVCDGCAYSGVDADTAYWIGQLGYFCPWSSRVLKEITAPLEIKNFLINMVLTIYPNPATSILYIEAAEKVNASIMSIEGKVLKDCIVPRNDAKGINISGFAKGMYMVRVYDENGILMKVEKVVKE